MVWVSTGVLGGLMSGFILVLLLAIRNQNTAAAVNTGVSLLAFLLSLLLVTDLQSPSANGLLVPHLPIWVAIAGLIHSVGMLGHYESVWWWDHLAHTISSALVAALLYGGLLVTIGPNQLPFTPFNSVGMLTVGLTVAVGVFWELIELVARAVGKRYDIEPVLIHYGWRDTALDLVFDFAGAILILGFDVRVFVELAAHSPGLTRTLLFWTSGSAVVGSAVMILALIVADELPV